MLKAKDFKRLAEAINKFLEEPESSRNFSSRNRIIQNFDIRKVVKDYEKNFQDVVNMSDGGL